jgi:hypothetical protein
MSEHVETAPLGSSGRRGVPLGERRARPWRTRLNGPLRMGHLHVRPSPPAVWGFSVGMRAPRHRETSAVVLIAQATPRGRIQHPPLPARKRRRGGDKFTESPPKPRASGKCEPELAEAGASYCCVRRKPPGRSRRLFRICCTLEPEAQCRLVRRMKSDVQHPEILRFTFVSQTFVFQTVHPGRWAGAGNPRPGPSSFVPPANPFD